MTTKAFFYTVMFIGLLISGLLLTAELKFRQQQANLATLQYERLMDKAIAVCGGSIEYFSVDGNEITTGCR